MIYTVLQFYQIRWKRKLYVNCAFFPLNKGNVKFNNDFFSLGKMFIKPISHSAVGKIDTNVLFHLSVTIFYFIKWWRPQRSMGEHGLISVMSMVLSHS
jgi:hypothetical protein